MENAKRELKILLNNVAKVKCAHISLDLYGFNNEDCKKFVLKLDYTENDYKEFLDSLNFNYDNGFGSQSLYGTIWLEDGTWLSREEYDGSEWWQHNKVPDIPIECFK